MSLVEASVGIFFQKAGLKASSSNITATKLANRREGLSLMASPSLGPSIAVRHYSHRCGACGSLGVTQTSCEPPDPAGG